jgi:hypothetical protein
VLKGKHIQKMNSFIYVLSGRMQNYIRNKWDTFQNIQNSNKPMRV